LQKIKKTYSQNKKTVTVLNDVDLSVSLGEFFFLLGPSGCGKTTLLKIIAGMIEPDSGTVLLGDREVTHAPMEKRNCALVFQNYALWPHMTVQQNVEFGPKMQRKDATLCRKIATKQLELVQMSAYCNRKSNQLSGGQQQRVALARALAAAPDCLLLDEPLSNLDAKLRIQMRTELRKLIKRSGATAIYVTHDQKEALAMADRIAIMHEGRIVQIGSPDEIYDRPINRFVADFVGEANFITGTVVETSPLIDVQTPIGILRSNSTASVIRGQQVICCVRPEKIRLFESISRKVETEPFLPNFICQDMNQIAFGLDSASVIPITIDYAYNLGEIRQHLLILPDQTLWKQTILSYKPLAIRKRQYLMSIEPHNITILLD
jgi:iron(III) transport system ATP-binding protein